MEGPTINGEKVVTKRTNSSGPKSAFPQNGHKTERFIIRWRFSIFGGQHPLPPNEKCIPWRKKWVSLGFIGGDAHAQIQVNIPLWSLCLQLVWLPRKEENRNWTIESFTNMYVFSLASMKTRVSILLRRTSTKSRSVFCQPEYLKISFSFPQFYRQPNGGWREIGNDWAVICWEEMVFCPS